MLRRVLYQITAALFGAAAVLAIPTAADAAALTQVSFTGSYSGTATLLVNASSGATTISNARGSGTGSLIGAGSFSDGAGSSGTLKNKCAYFSGSAVLSGSHGSIKLTVGSSNKACSNVATSSGPATITVESGSATVSDGTGAAAGATGTLSFNGATLTTNASESSGNFTITFTGTLSIASAPTTTVATTTTVASGKSTTTTVAKKAKKPKKGKGKTTTTTSTTVAATTTTTTAVGGNIAPSNAGGMPGAAKVLIGLCGAIVLACGVASILILLRSRRRTVP